MDSLSNPAIFAIAVVSLLCCVVSARAEDFPGSTPLAIVNSINDADMVRTKESVMADMAASMPLAEKGDKDAQLKIGKLYDVDGALAQSKEKGGYLGSAESDFENAKLWYGKAAAQGNVRAEAYLGRLYMWGAGTDVSEGLRLLQKSSDAGDVEAPDFLGDIYAQGVGVAVDFAKSVNWYRVAAIRGHKDAARAVGIAYGEGLYMNQNLLKAYAWFTISEKIDRRSLAKHMTPEQVEAADRMVEQIKAGHGDLISPETDVRAQQSPKAAQATGMGGFDTCYDENAKTGTTPTDEDGDADFPKSWHRQFVLFLDGGKPDAANLPADIKALPDIGGTDYMQGLHIALAHERENGRDTLLLLVQKFHGRNLEGLMDPAAREEARQILFTWTGVEKVDPASRGPFVDAREVAVLEKMLGDPYLQIGRYPNPAPGAARVIKEEFRSILDYTFSNLASQGSGKFLFSSAAEFAATHRILSEASLKKLADRASTLARPEERLAFWQNVIGTIPTALFSRLTDGDATLLQTAIQSSAPELDVHHVVNSRRPPQNIPYDRAGRALRFQITYGNEMNYRLICYSYLAKQ